MNSIAKRMSSILNRPSLGMRSVIPEQIQQWRGIRVRVFDGNLEQALGALQRKMRSSGMERLINRQQKRTRHIKNSEKRVLARKALQHRIQAQALSRKLQTILQNKVRGL